MATHQSTQIASRQPIPSAQAFEPIAIVGDYAIPAGITSSDVVEMVGLPAGYVPVDVIVDTASLGSTMTAKIGLLSGDYGSTATRTCGAEFMTGKAFGTAGIYRADVAGFGRIAPTDADRGVGLQFTTATTPTAGAVVRVTLIARPKAEGV